MTSQYINIKEMPQIAHSIDKYAFKNIILLFCYYLHEKGIPRIEKPLYQKRNKKREIKPITKSDAFN